jgi:hypothetical protein
VVLIVSALSFCEEPEKVTACKLKNDPAAYSHKLVEMEGFISHGFEDFTFFDPNCPYSPTIWLEYGGTAASGTIYCCGPSNARSRPKELVVDGVSIPLVDNEQFRQFDKLIHDESDTVVYATVIGRFFSGEKQHYPSGGWGWGGYGHLGCCSLLAIQQILAVDPHDRDDLDYRASPDQPDLDKLKCGTFQGLEPVPSARATFDIQHRAEAGERVWVFNDPRKVALDFLAQNLHLDERAITGISERKDQGRMVYEWHPAGKPETYMVVVSRQYWLSFYAENERKVAWVVLAAYKACGD